VLFRKLEREQLREIVGLLLGGTAGRLAAQGVVLDVDAAATDWIVDHGHEPEFGARPLRRTIQREVDDRIADLMVSGAVVAGGRVAIRVGDDGELVAQADEPAGAAL
jgi:ATP-dependent Clp protease ATP-binding subunit ClpC